MADSDVVLTRNVIADRLGRSARAAGLLVVAATFAVLSPRFLTTYNLLNVLRQASLLAIISFGMTLTMITGGLDLSVGSVVALSSCVAATFLVRGHTLAGILSGVGVGALCGAVSGLVIARLALPPFVVTYGMQRVARGLALAYTGGLSIYGFSNAFRWIGTGFLFRIPAPVIAISIIFVVLFLVMKYTVFGRAVYAVGASATTARFSGIKVHRTLFWTYLASGVLSGVAGIIYIARVNAAEPVIGELFPLDAIAASVIGGTPFSGGEGGIGGTVLGAIIIAVLQNGLSLLGVSSHWQVFTSGLVIVIAVLLDMVIRRRR